MIVASENARLPDSAIRLGIRGMLSRRRADLLVGGCEAQQNRRQEFIDHCASEPIAAVPELANEQHYEVPAEFFHEVLGTRLKYSCCYWSDGTTDLAAAETTALLMTCERAGLESGQSILELGCGWGSLSLWMAEHYPESQILAVSNSRPQREFIEQRARSMKVTNLSVQTADINVLQLGQSFDRVVSVEMFEHTRNHAQLMKRIATWLKPGGKLFVHHFCHQAVPYFYEPKGEGDWMAQHFFSGGIMPSDDLLLHYQSDLSISRQWRWNGQHYEKTCNAWLANLDLQRNELLSVLAEVYGDQHASLWLQRWRIFFMACAELFAYRSGDEWWVTHKLFEK